MLHNIFFVLLRSYFSEISWWKQPPFQFIWKPIKTSWPVSNTIPIEIMIETIIRIVFFRWNISLTSRISHSSRDFHIEMTWTRACIACGWHASMRLTNRVADWIYVSAEGCSRQLDNWGSCKLHPKLTDVLTIGNGDRMFASSLIDWLQFFPGQNGSRENFNWIRKNLQFLKVCESNMSTLFIGIGRGLVFRR